MIITIFFIGVYYLWIFVLSVVPIAFSTPVGKNNLQYYTEFAYSLTMTFGNYGMYLFKIYLYMKFR